MIIRLYNKDIELQDLYLKQSTGDFVVDRLLQHFAPGDEVTIKFLSGGGCGGCLITKITNRCIYYIQGSSRVKRASLKDIKEIYIGADTVRIECKEVENE